MKPSVLGALIGAVTGFSAVLLLKSAVISSTFLRAILFPGNLFVTYSNGMSPFGHMIFDTLAYFSNLLIYATVGYLIGLLFQTNRESSS